MYTSAVLTGFLKSCIFLACKIGRNVVQLTYMKHSRNLAECRKDTKMQEDLLVQIENKMSTFSKSQKLIANYIINSYEKAAYMTALKLGNCSKRQRIHARALCHRNGL